MSQDACCWACRSATGICLTRFQCEHHREYDAKEEANAKARRTHRDPTAGQAVNNVMREHKKKGRPR